MTTLDWTSPLRERKSQAGETLPVSQLSNEIYLEIFSFLKPDDPEFWIGPETRLDLVNLALVCRYFYSVVLPWCFECFIVGKESDTAKNMAQGRLFQRMIDKDPSALAIASYVKRLALIDTYPCMPEHMKFIDMAVGASALRMRNLREVVLRGALAPHHHLSSLTKILTMEKISVVECITITSMAPQNGFRVRDLTLYGMESSFLGRFDLRCLRQLSLTSFLPLQNNKLATDLQLEQLEIVESDAASDRMEFEGANLNSLLLPFLEKCLALKNLHIIPNSRTRHHHDHLPRLPPGTLPVLSKIEGPWSLCECLIPDRPIESIKILHSFSPNEITPPDNSFTAALSLVNARERALVQSLQLPAVCATEEWCNVISKLFPKLRSLEFEMPRDPLYPSTRSISIGDFSNGFRQLLSTLNHPTVLTLVFVFWEPFDHPDVLNGVEIKNCPSLQQVDFVRAETRRSMSTYARIEGEWRFIGGPSWNPAFD